MRARNEWPVKSQAPFSLPPPCWRQRRPLPRWSISTLRCKQFIELPKETLNAVTLWLDAYLTDEEEFAVIDFDKMKDKAGRLAAYCAQNPEMSLMTAAENVMVK